VRVKAVLEYLGTDYAGWQVQPNAPTVQAQLEKALTVATGREVRVEGAGRTDAGVHASGQVAAFDLADGSDLYRLRGALNGLTPTDISILALDEVDGDFDPRRHALRRSYRYTLVCGRPPSPLLGDRSWYVPVVIKEEQLNELAALMLGRHDFSAFRASNCESPNTEREVYKSRWCSREEGVVVYEVTANAFLKQMVRVMVGTMVDVCLGRLSRDCLAVLLSGGSRTEAGRTAPARGLVLVGVEY
jgi:tRNA pseudouridine38-40 synthase